MTRLLVALASLFIITACASPEVRRTRGGDSGADLGNRGKVMQMHEGSKPYYETPQLIDSRHAAESKKLGDQASPR